jgi:DNA-binding response OmpR family regulator
LLIVDDTADIVEFLRAFFADPRIRIEAAETASEALSCAGRAAPDAALVDLRLSGLGGRELAERLGALGIARERVIIMSAGAERVEGGFGWVEKPFDHAALRRTVFAALDLDGA